MGCTEAGSTEGNDLAGELRRAGSGANEPQEHGKAVGAVKGAGVVSAQGSDAGSVRELSEWKGLVKAPLQAEAFREDEHGFGSAKVCATKGALRCSQGLTPEWLCLIQLTLVLQ